MARSQMPLVAKPPFPAACQLCGVLDDDLPMWAYGLSSQHQYLPGYPHVSLRDGHGLLEFLKREYCSADLDRVACKLWWMSKQDSGNISPLHRQFVKQRRIIVTEDPKLHLVWIHDRIFIKPLPRYLTSFTFWRDYLGSDEDLSNRTSSSWVRRAALGYLRTYYYLVQSESDFRVAQDPSLCLISAGITWEQFCNFAQHLASVNDCDVSERYTYGEIRLTRLNFYAPLILGKSHFQRVESQYGAYFGRFYGPILFIIGSASVILNGLQVVLSTDQLKSLQNGESLLLIALWFSVAIILCVWAILLSLFSLLIYKIAKEWRYAVQSRLRRLEAGQLK